MSEVDVEVEDPAWLEAASDVEALVRAAALAALSGRSEGTVAILLSDNGAVRSLNAKFRGRDAATNVLAFEAHPSAAPHIGDVILAYGVCAEEAEGQNKPLRHHVLHLTIHGVLHLMGYSHEAESDAQVMEGLETALLAAMDVPDPYCWRGNHGRP